MRRHATLLLLGALACSGDKADSAVSAQPTGDPAAQLRVTPEGVDFGTLTVGSTGSVEGEITQLVALRNIGQESLAVSSVQIEGGGGAFSVTSLAVTTLAPNARTDVVVTLEAVTLGEHTAMLAIASDDPGQPLVEVALFAELVEDGGGETCPCPDGYTARDDASECFRVTEAPATATGDTWDACPIVPNEAYGRYGARLPDGGNVQSAFWGEDNGAANGRLNDAGVWACDAAGGATTGEQPTGAWIGFSVCLDVATDGDYLLGLGADNRTRLRVDGVEVFS